MIRRSTIRWRLTRLFGLTFVGCGVLLLATSYVMVRASLSEDEGNSGRRVTDLYDFSPSGVQRFYDFPVPDPGPDAERQAATVGDVIAGVQTEISSDALRQLVLGSGVALVLMGIVSVGLGWVAAGRALRPVGDLTDRAQSMSQDDLHERIALEGPQDEMKELADTLDGLIARLETAFDAQRAFASHVSHELRTPLAIMSAEADLALARPDATESERRLARSVSDAAGRSEALLDALLALARSESTMSERHRVDVAELAGDVVSDRLDRAHASGVRIDLSLADTAEVDGDRWLLERLLANLVDNGITHNVRGGWLRVTVEVLHGTAVVRTSNTGEVLSPTQVGEILEPFHRVSDGRRPGYGLGMTIVCSVAKAHGGTVDLFPRAEGGLDVEVSLPLAAARPSPPREPPAVPAVVRAPAVR